MASMPNAQEQGGGGFDFLQLLTLPFSVVGNLFGQPNGSGVFDSPPVTDEQSGPAWELLHSYHGNGLSNAQVEIFGERIRNAPSQAALTEIINDITSFGEIGASRQSGQQLDERIEQTRQTQLGNIGDLEGRGRGLLQGQIDRYQGIIDSGVRSDAEFAKILGDSEKQLAAQINSVQLGAAKGLADSGAREAGKATDRTRQAESRAFGELSNVSSTLAGQAITARDTAARNLLGFDEQITNARNAAEAGAVPSLLGAQQLSQSSPIPQGGFGLGTQFDITSANVGANSLGAGMTLQTILGLLGAQQNQTDSFLGTAGNIFGGGR